MYQPLISGGTVRRLGVGETKLYREHLLRLDAESRRSRFGGAVSDEFVRHYAESFALSRVLIYGFFVDDVLRGAAELRLLEHAGDAEAALSVEKAWQSRGVGSALFERVLLVARNRQIERLHVLCLAENWRMQQLARKFHAQLSFQSGDAIGKLKAPRPTPISIMRELVADRRQQSSTSPRISPSGSSIRTARLSVERGILDTSALMLVDNWR
jgi:GNAT superfamily N-acetyltransferase